MRQFISEKDIDDSGILILENKDYHYFKDVLRVKVGDKLRVRFPDGSLDDMLVEKIDEDKKQLELHINTNLDEFDFGDDITHGVKPQELTNLQKTEIWLFQFLPRLSKFEQIVRQATECGVSVIVPVIGEYTENSSVISMNNDNKTDRMQKIIKEARQQSGSPIDTKVLLPVPLVEALKVWRNRIVDDDGIAFALCERDDVYGEISKSIEGQKINIAAIACGSEGGISPDEIERLKNDGGFIPIHFDTNILRCETAAVYGIAALQTCIASELKK